MKIFKVLLLILGLVLCGFSLYMLAFLNLMEFGTRSANQEDSLSIDVVILVCDMVIVACVSYTMYKMVLEIKQQLRT